MKPKFLLIISAALNVLLLLYIVRPEAGKDGVSPGPSESASPPASVPGPGDGGDAAATSTRRFTWELVESPDYREYIANLRRIGCPEETIRDIIVADVNKLYSAKKRELRGEPKRYEYWKASSPWLGQVDAGYLAEARALEEEKLRVLRELGIEPDVRMQMGTLFDASEAMTGMFGFLPEAKQVDVMKIMQDMQAEMAESAGDGGLDMVAVRETQKRMEDAVRAILTPEEYREYELRMSVTANTLRNQLAGWDPDEAEFLQVFELRKAFDDEFSVFDRGSETEQERARRQQAEAELNKAIQLALGEERYASYQRAQDWSFQQIHQAAKRAELGTREAVQVYDMKEAAEAEVRNLRQNQDLTHTQRMEALQGIQAETERSIKAVLGEEGWSQYNRGPNTAWLRNLVPASPTLPAARE